MSGRRRKDPEWREFERLIARIEADAGAHGISVKSPDRLRCKITGRLREVDASIRVRVGGIEVLTTIECRMRSKVEDVTWIEQLATKRTSIGAASTIAVSSSGFSKDAEIVASHVGISLRTVSELTAQDLNPLLGLGLVIFWHKACAVTGAGVRTYRAHEAVVPEPDQVDYVFPCDTDLFAPIFRNNEDGSRWSLNDVWREVQSALNPYAEIEKDAPPVVRTARIPYPGTVVVETPEGTKQLGHLFLSIAMWIEPEFVSAGDALKVDYAEPGGSSLQRVEFSSVRTLDWRISLQTPAHSTEISDLRTGGNWPNRE